MRHDVIADLVLSAADPMKWYRSPTVIRNQGEAAQVKSNTILAVLKLELL